MLPLSVDVYPHWNSSRPLGLKTKPKQLPTPLAGHECAESTIFTQVPILVDLQVCHEGCRSPRMPNVAHISKCERRVRRGVAVGSSQPYLQSGTKAPSSAFLHAVSMGDASAVTEFSVGCCEGTLCAWKPNNGSRSHSRAWLLGSSALLRSGAKTQACKSGCWERLPGAAPAVLTP